MTQIVSPPGGTSIVAIAAHPDDIERWCAGTLALAHDVGSTVRLLLVTSGERGTSDPYADTRVVAVRREVEAREAAQRLGIAEVAFLRQPDSELEDTRELRKHLVAALRRWRPAVVFTHDPEHPWPPYLSHRDHRVVGRAVLDAVYPLARDPLSFPEHLQAGLQPHAISEVWLFASAQPDSFVDINGALNRKIAARQDHVSQTDDPDALAKSWRIYATHDGSPVNLAQAEAFKVLRLSLSHSTTSLSC